MRRLLSHRRSLLAGAAALVGAGLARLGGAERAEATHAGAGLDVIMGGYNNLFNSRPTFVANSDDTEPAFIGINGKVPGTTFDYLGIQDGIQAITNKTGGAGVRGLAPDFAVVGQVSRGGAPNSNTAVGVLGQTSFGAAVRGEITGGSEATGTGVVGVAGGCAFGNASSVGVGGSGRGTGKTGVLGITDSVGVGVQGWATSSGTGIRGSSNSGGGPDFGGSGTGVDGRSGSGSGVYGKSTSGAGVYGEATQNAAIFGVSPLYSVYGFALGGGTAVYGQATTANGWGGQFAGRVFVNGSLTVVNGAKSAAVKKRDGSHARVYCQESPEPWFEDFGTAELKNGQASVPLDPEFDEVVKGDDYRVFLTAIGDTGFLYVSRKGPHRFEVRSERGATAQGSFDYRVVARRADPVGGRLEKVEIPAPPDAARQPKPPKAVDPKEQQPVEAQPVVPQPTQGGRAEPPAR